MRRFNKVFAVSQSRQQGRSESEIRPNLRRPAPLERYPYGSYVGGAWRQDQKRIVDSANTAGILALAGPHLRVCRQDDMRLGAIIAVVLVLTPLSCGRSRPVARQDASVATSAASTKARPPTVKDPAKPSSLAEVRIAAREHSPVWKVEVVSTEAERSRGLMYRRSLADDRGMMFLMPEDHDWAFYMRNTYVALDMIFIDSDWTVVGLSANTRPLTEELHRSGRPCRYVLELVAHQARRSGIRVGTRLTFTQPATAPPRGGP